jgi:Divergent InlB B-repeat domain/Domain of unknown function DUF11
MTSRAGRTALVAIVVALVFVGGAGSAPADAPAFTVGDVIAPGTVSPGSSATITVTAANTGTDQATMYFLLDLGPGAWSLGPASQQSGPPLSCSTTQYDMTCSIATWPGGASASINVPVTVDAAAVPGTILNSRDYVFQGAPGGASLASAAYSLVVGPAVTGGGGGNGGGNGGGGGTPAPAPAPATATLTLTRGGSGSGTVTSAPAGIDCGSTCSHAFSQGTSVTLTEAADTGSVFAGWDGACKSAGTTSTCTIALNADTQVSASFDVPPPPPAPDKPVSTPLRRPTQHAGCTVARLPDRECTPGAIFATFTAGAICTPGYTDSVGPVPASTKKRVLAAYGIPSSRAGRYVLDHLVPVRLGGSNDRANLWPEATAKPPAAREKDHLETWLLGRVCSGATSLAKAQTAIARNWVAAYRGAGLG